MRPHDRIGLLGLLCVMVLAFRPGGAAATQMRVVGGPGGRVFTSVCAHGTYLAGFSARTGAWIDGIALVCAPYDTAHGRLSKARSSEQYVGGPRGEPQEEYCALGRPLTGISMTFTQGNGLDRQYLNSLGMLCGGESEGDQRVDDHDVRCISTGEPCYGFYDIVFKWGYTTRDHLADYQFCPREEYAVGIQGRSGDYVDAIGLICAPAPAVPAPLPASTHVRIGSGGRASPSLPSGSRFPQTVHLADQHAPGVPSRPTVSAPPDPGHSAAVKADVDVYAQPGGRGQPIGVLRAGTRVQAVSCRPDRWCHVGAKGWVWGEFLQQQ